MSKAGSKAPIASPLQQAACAGVSFNSETIELNEIAGTAIVRLHSLEPGAQLAEKTGRIGVNLPVQTSHSTGSEPSVLCIRPQEWLLFTEQIDSAELMAKLQPVIEADKTALLDMSDGLGVFRLSGAGAAWLLCKLSGLDFVAGVSGGQHCARTRMAQIAVVVHFHQAGGPDSPYVFDLIFDRSLAKYLWELLTASANHANDLVKSEEM